MVRTILSKKQEQPIFLSLSPQKINAVNVNSGHIHNTQCLQQVNMSVINSATDDQMAESDSCYVVDGKLMYQGTKWRNRKKKEKKKGMTPPRLTLLTENIPWEPKSTLYCTCVIEDREFSPRILIFIHCLSWHNISVSIFSQFWRYQCMLVQIKY